MKNDISQKVETGTLRPPSEAKSLFVRVVRNCPWNKCTFCPAYKGEKFSVRSVDEIINGIQNMAQQPNAGEIKSIFLQDADAMVIPADDLEIIVSLIKKSFPSVERITSYARSNTLMHKTVDELEMLKKAGLTRIHVGVESGCNEVLEFVKKGTTFEKHLEGCLRVKKAGIELGCYVMPGLGGKKYTEAHARETGKLIAAIEPTHVRLRTSFVLENTPMAEEYLAGNFIPLSDEETIEEIKIFFSYLQGIKTEFISDHRMNLLLELQGKLPEDYPLLKQTIDRFQNLSPEDRNLFVIGRRLNIVKCMYELYYDGVKDKIKQRENLYDNTLPVSTEIFY